MYTCFPLCFLCPKDGALLCVRGNNCVAFWGDTNLFSSSTSRWQSCLPKIFIALNFPSFYISRFASLGLSISLLFVWFSSTFEPSVLPLRKISGSLLTFLCWTYCNLQGANLIISLVTTNAAGRVTQKVWAWGWGGGCYQKEGTF